MSEERIPRYNRHSGTVCIAGRTIPRRAAVCALHFLESTAQNSVDFLCIGANADHQAAKAMAIMAFIFNQSEMAKRGIFIAFEPLRFQVETVHPVTAQHVWKDAMVWRVVLYQNPVKI